jgi:hypothetical protein
MGGFIILAASCVVQMCIVFILIDENNKLKEKIKELEEE